MAFEDDELWSSRVAAEYLAVQLPGLREWSSWLENDRRKKQPVLEYTKFCGYNILYPRPVIEAFIENTRRIKQ